ncbi:MAG TPA: hypothetical protein VFM84_08315 [Holophagaceae bacterium]|nr:hypothetical protein [Holophagaceae bacterium]
MNDELAPAPPPANAAEQVGMPAMGLMLAGALGILGNIVLLLLHFGALTLGGLSSFTGGGMGGMMAGSIGLFFRIVGLAACCFVIYGGMQMKSLGNYTMALVAAIVAVIPCFIPCPCCFVGIGAGIWAIIVLIKPEVKAAFAQK